MVEQLKMEFERSNELFIEHYKKNYESIFPIWVILEVSSFGFLSKMYSNLKDEDQREIGIEYYNIKPDFIRTWLYSLSALRNICAHYGRLYNRKLEISPKLFKKDKKIGIINNTVFSMSIIIGRLLKDKKEWNEYVTNLSALLEKYQVVDIELLGFPKDWEVILREV